MVSLETVQPAVNRSTAMDNQTTSSPRISFSAEFLDENNFISISPNHHHRPNNESENQKPPLSPSPIRTAASAAADLQFEFLSNSGPTAGHSKMLTADELFFEGKLLPFWQMQQSERLNKISLKCHEDAENPAGAVRAGKEDAPPTPTATRAVNWFVDDDPSPRPPKCTVLWKELLRLKKQRPASSLSPSSSSSSTSSSSSSLADAAVAAAEEKKEGNNKKISSKEGSNNNNQVKRAAKKGLERTRSASIRIRPMINVPICSQMKSTAHSSALPPFFPIKKNRVVER
ncbi:unnamed protein product [Linum tenue]|uniref:Uncharacterized protein n=1 Tax=Linum tenue TaxID=586396 RepID=A0AAV0P4Y4_9ROSI|nr:unnamed protein product [Linum tenue]